MSGYDIYTPPGGPPQIEPLDPSIYTDMGPENIFAMVADFYSHLSQSSISHMFPKTQTELNEAAYKSGCFFVGLLGGPPIYQQQFGPPRLRARHFPWPIDEEAKKTWLECFETTLEDACAKYAFPAKHLPKFIEFLQKFSGWMVNKPPVQTK